MVITTDNKSNNPETEKGNSINEDTWPSVVSRGQQMVEAARKR